MKKTFLSLVITLFIINALSAQSRNPKYEAYIEKYAEFAIQCQNEHHIPASITLAQGILESGAGESSLAKECNNHFGIKCGSDWYGRSTRRNDDRPNECFRCYKSAKESYDDHAKFLQRQRYAFLYDYKITDYKSWAYGLKQAGYATDPKYPQKLINIIETYKLYEFDTQGSKKTGGAKKREEKQKQDPTLAEENLFGYVEIVNNGVRCYKLLTDDSFKNISKATGISIKRLLYYNDLPAEIDLYRDDYVYLTKKRNTTKKRTPIHKVRSGESLHSIAQEYGITLKALYKLNELEYGTPAKVGMKLKLHK